MISMHFLDSSAASAALTHILQSTAFAALAWLLALALRHYPARVRFWVWMSASVKFLVPFALLTSLGARWARPRPQPVHIVIYKVLEQFNQPFAKGNPLSPGPELYPHSMHASSWIAIAIAAMWLCGCLAMLVRWTRPWLSARHMAKDGVPVNDGPELVALRSAEAEARRCRPIPIVVISKAVEPGIFGVMRPVLLWPAGLSERLDEAQIRAIVAHELEHVRRRDNLSSVVHALVEALFWFHPAVHWMRSKMSEERERACDESVIAQSAQPQKYAESILKVCAFCLESPLLCVAGVSGSDLKQRVMRIVKQRPGVTLTAGRKALLAAAALLAVALPVGFGVVHGQTGAAADLNTATRAVRDLPKYEVASVKPASSNDGMSRLMLTPDGMMIQGIPLQMVLRQAFGVEDDRIVGAPSWTRSNRYDIETKVAPEDAPSFEKLKEADRQAMLIPVLQERFNLKFHHETRQLPMYALVVAKGGPKLAKGEPLPPASQEGVAAGQNHPGGPTSQHFKAMMGPGNFEADSVPMTVLVSVLSQFAGRTVLDKTGLTGSYNFKLQWTPDNAPPPMLGGPGGPGGPAHADTTNDAPQLSLFAAIQEQLGLKLESEKGSVDVIVIDHIDLPTPN